MQGVNLDSYPDLLTVPEVATILRVDCSYIYRLIRQRRLVVLRLTPHKTRVPKENLQLFLASTQTEGLQTSKLSGSASAEAS